jgi:hypothetical protein
MRGTESWLFILGVLTLCAMPAQSQDWSKLARLKHGTLIQVHSVGAPLGVDDRCRLDAVDPSTLSCIREGDGTTRLVYPADRVATVYRVLPKGPTAAAWIAEVAGVIGLLGIVTLNAELFTIGVVGEVAAFGVWVVHGVIMIAQPPHPPQECLKVVYRL